MHAETERIQAYSEAVFSIVATLMAVPLHYDEEDAEAAGGFSQYLFGRVMRRKVAVFFVSFFLVLMFRALHVRVMRALAHVPRSMVYLNHAFLFLCGTLPLTAFTERVVWMAIVAAALVGISWLMWREMRADPNLVQPALVAVREAGGKDFVWEGQFTALAPLPSAILVIALSQAVETVVWETVGALLLAATFALVIWRGARRMRELPQGLVTVNRDEYFTDGVMAISGTLSLVDASTGYMNGEETGRELAMQLIAFTLAFTVISLLWHSNHVLLHLIHAPRMTYSFFNYLLLTCVALMPFVSSILSAALMPDFPAGDAVAAAEMFLFLCFCATAMHTVICVELYRNVAHSVSPQRAFKYRISVIRSGLLPLAVACTMPLVVWTPWNILWLFPLVPLFFRLQHQWERAKTHRREPLSAALLAHEAHRDSVVAQEIEQAQLVDAVSAKQLQEARDALDDAQRRLQRQDEEMRGLRARIAELVSAGLAAPPPAARFSAEQRPS